MPTDMHKPDVSVSSSTDDEEMDLPGLIKEGGYNISQPQCHSYGCRKNVKYGWILLVVLILGVIFATKQKLEPESSPANSNLQIKDWLPLGLPLVGKESNSLFGFSLALSSDGKVVAAGAPFGDDSELKENAGHVRVYEWNNDDVFLPVSGNELGGESGVDWFGSSVALSGDGLILAAGGDGSDANGEISGLIRVFRRDNLNMAWKQVGKDVIGNGDGDAFGTAVALSEDGQILVVGASEAYQEDGRGYVRVFAYLHDLNQWIPMGPDLVGKSVGCEFGSSVALSSAGRILAVAAPKHDNSTGKVQIYEYDEENEWKQQGQNLTGLSEGNVFGQTFDMSADGKVVAVAEEGVAEEGVAEEGVLNAEQGENGYGLVRVFAWNATTNLWDQLGQTLYSEEVDEYFGSSVSLSADGQTLAVGVFLNDEQNGASFSEYFCHVRVFALDRKRNRWQQIGLDIDGIVDDEALGASLALSANGTIVAAGAIGNNTAGHVRLYQAIF